MWGRGEEEMRGNFLQKLAAMRNCRPFSLHLPPTHPLPCVLGANSNRQEPSQCTVIPFFFKIEIIALYADILKIIHTTQEYLCHAYFDCHRPTIGGAKQTSNNKYTHAHP